MAHIRIRGCGPVGGFGFGMRTLAEGVEKSAVSPVQCEEGQEYLITSLDWLNTHLQPNKLRRIDRFGRLALTALFLCLDDAGLSAAECGDCGVILASGYGPVSSSCQFKDTLINNGPVGASPTAFTKSVHNQAAAHIAMILQSNGPVAAICQHWFPVQSALQLGCLWLAENRVPRVLVGMIDEWPDFFDYCLDAYGRGQDAQMAGQGHWLGNINGKLQKAEGGAFFLLEKSDVEQGLSLKMVDLSPVDMAGYYPDDSEQLVIGDVSSPSETSKFSDNLDKFRSYRHLYGHFPTAGALDFSSLLAGMRQGRGKFIETNFSGQSCCMEVKAKMATHRFGEDQK